MKSEDIIALYGIKEYERRLAKARLWKENHCTQTAAYPSSQKDVRAAYYQTNKTAILAKNKVYYGKHKKEHAARSKVYAKTHKSEIALHAKTYREEHLEELRTRSRTYYKFHREELLAYQLKYCEDHKSEKKSYDEIRREAHHDEILANRKSYAKNNREEINARSRAYLKTDAGKAANRRHYARHKQLGFIPLNSYFEGCEGHHITHDYVIYIPKWLHRSIRHALDAGKNMKEINALASSFLLEGF